MRHLTAISFLLIGCSTVHSVPQTEDVPSYDGGTDPSQVPDSQAPVSQAPLNNVGINAGVNDAGITLSADAGTTADSGSNAGDGGVVVVAEPPHCGDPGLALCQLGDGCRHNSDCSTQACNYLGKCIEDKSCINYYGGATCGFAEVGDPAAKHESCCKSLPIPGYSDPTRPGSSVYLDKYEITAGRMRAFVDAVIAEQGKPDFKSWLAKHRPATWDDSWTQFLPSDYEGDTLTINRMLLGDPRAIPGPGVIMPPATDQVVSTGLNHQFGGTVFADTHGNNCGSYSGAYGFPTYYYSDNVQAVNGEVARPNPKDVAGNVLNAKDALDVKSLNCSTNAMFQLLCSFDGGEVMSNEVFDFVTATPSNRWLDMSGCGVQFSVHGDLLANIINTSVFIGGRCADLYGGGVNAFFDAGQALPVAGSFLNTNFYQYPDYGGSADDKSWVVAGPGRMYRDVVRTTPTDEGWMDLAGNLTETVLDKSGGVFSGKFSLRGQGIGFGSERSALNTSLMPGETIMRVQRPEVKSGLVGARCVRFK